MDEQNRLAMLARGLGGGLVLLLSAELMAQTTLDKLSFEALSDGRDELRLAFVGEAPAVSGFVTEQPARIALDMMATASRLDRQIPVDLSYVRSVAVLETEERTRVVLALARPASYDTWIQDSTLYVRLGDEATASAAPGQEQEVTPALVPEKAVTEDFTAVQTAAAVSAGQPAAAREEDLMSLDFQDIAVRDVLQILADFKGFNLVASDTVTGNITLRLKDVPWNQALAIVLSARGLGQRQDGNILVVAPAAELSNREREQLESSKQLRDLAPLHTELLQINYANAEEIANVLLGGEGNRTLSERGSVQIIQRTNSLLVRETRSQLKKIRELLSQVDVPVRQVQIEARIVAADTSFRKELGVRWGGAFQLGTGNHLRAGGRGGAFQAADSAANGNFVSDATDVAFGNNNLFTDLSVTGTGASALSIGLLTDSSLLNLELSALEADGGGEIVSRPRVITSDKQQATIRSGQEIPFQETSAGGGTSVSFKDAVLSLEVTPQITPDGRIIMDIKVNNDSSTESTATGIPIIDTTEVSTKVLIDDGQTIVLGGIFTNTTQKGVSKVPFLGDLPGVGRLFRRDIKQDTRGETLIFITPKVLGQP